MSENDKTNAAAAAGSEADAAAVDAMFADLKLKKKKKKKKKDGDKDKKKKKKKKSKEKSGEDKTAAEGTVFDNGTPLYDYSDLLQRVYDQMKERNPNISEKKRYRMVPPEVVRIGPRTMWVNFPDSELSIVGCFVLLRGSQEYPWDGWLSSSLFLKHADI